MEVGFLVLMPGVTMIDAAFGIADEVLLPDQRLPLLVLPLDDSHLAEQADQCPVLSHRHGQVVRSPGIGAQW